MIEGIRSTRSIGVLSLLAVLGMLVFSATAANAAQGDTSTCSFTGLTGSLTPAVPHAPGGQNVDGTYTFGGTATCVAADDGEPDGTSGGIPFTVNIQSDGYYSNAVCGTGSVAGTAGVGSAPASEANDFGTGPPPPPTTPPFNYFTKHPNPGGYTGVGFGINFNNGNGKLGGGAISPDGDASDVTGHVTIVPTQGNCATTDVTEFMVAGAFNTL